MCGKWHRIGRSYANDTNLTFSAVDLSILQTEMSSSNKLIEDCEKTDFMVISFRQRIETLHGNALTLQQVETTKCLGLTIDQFLTRGNHFQSVKQEVGCSIRIFKMIRPFIGLKHLLNLYRSIL